MNTRKARLAVVVCLGLAAGSAGAGVMPNGLMPNGLMPNGLMPNGLMPNGLMPNGLMPNGLMPNGLMPNGLMPNGLMPNGLMPNGLTSYSIYGDMFAVVDGKNVTFSEWFAIDPAGRSDFMKYFVRCAYGPGVEVSFRSQAPAPHDVSSKEDYAEGDGERHDRHRDDSDGRDHPTYRWPGFFGLAQTSLEAKVQMTTDEAKWVSSCLLAFVNTKGTHQYLSLQLLPGVQAPSAAAAAALTPTPAEARTMRWAYGQFMADLAGPAPTRYACYRGVQFPYFPQIENVLGRTCDTTPCTYVDPAGQTQNILTGFWDKCAFPESDNIAIGSETYHAIAVFGPEVGEFEDTYATGRDMVFRLSTEMLDVATCWGGKWPNGRPYLEWCTADEQHFTKLIDPSQRATCLNRECLGSGDTTYTPKSEKLVGLVDGQAVDAQMQIGDSTRPMDPDQDFTAIIRYTKDRTGSANIWTSDKGGAWRDATAFGDGSGPDIWKSTGTSDQFEWMQVYPAYAVPDILSFSPGFQVLKVRVSGASMSESCTGAPLFKGANEQGFCDKVFPAGHPRNNTVCPKEFERAPTCLGKLVWQKKHGAWGWYCRGGGEALFACTAADAPDLDAVSFISGKPWCMPEGATSFVGVCK
jgi:hypothetical protein